MESQQVIYWRVVDGVFFFYNSKSTSGLPIPIFSTNADGFEAVVKMLTFLGHHIISINI